LILRNTNIVICHNVCSLSRKTTFKIKSDGSVEISFSLFNLSSLSFLVSFNQPLEIIFFELSNIRMVFLFSNLNGFIPSVKFLIHSHSFFNFISLKKNRFSSMELFVKDSKFGLNSEIINTFGSNKFVDLSQVISFGYVSKSCIASFSNIEILLLSG